MKLCGKCKKEKDESAFGKLKSSKDGLRSTCKECRKMESAVRYQNNKEKVAAYYKKEYEKNPNKFLARSRRWKDANKEHRYAVNKQWRKANKERIAEVSKVWYDMNKEKVAKYKKDNRGLYNALNAKREASKKQRTPSYTNLDIIKDLYEYAAYLTKTTGIEYHVDHIIPLQGDMVSGFHIESNLQVIPKKENLKKGNTFVFDGGFYGSCILYKTR